MQEVSPAHPAFAEVEHGTDLHSTRVELILESHRVVGQLRQAGPARRLVDILNVADSATIVVHDGELHDLSFVEEQARSFEAIHVRRDAVLFAVPRAGPARRPNPFEHITKVPVPVTIVLPGFEITGNIYLAPDANPALASLLASRRFIPLTDAAVVPVQDRGRIWQEPIIVVNLGRALTYAPERGQKA